MPAFTFEKIAPPTQNAAPAQPKILTKTKPTGSRSLVDHLVNRLAMARLRHEKVKGRSTEEKT